MWPKPYSAGELVYSPWRAWTHRGTKTILCGSCRGRPVPKPRLPPWGSQPCRCMCHEMVREYWCCYRSQKVLSKVWKKILFSALIKSYVNLNRNFTNIEESDAEGYTVTHAGHCGACSTLQDLGVYIRQNLTDSTRMCGFLGTVSPTLMRDCLMSLGFSLPCITIWEWNILNTKAQCFQVIIHS